MTSQLSQRLNWPSVGEYAREYFQNRSHSYDIQDLIAIASGQVQHEKEISNSSIPGFICDTNILTIVIWAEIKFGYVPHILHQLLEEDKTHLYLLSKPDFKYALDPLREDIGIQSMLFDYYLNRLLAYGYNFTILAGTTLQRKSTALKAIENTLMELNRIE